MRGWRFPRRSRIFSGTGSASTQCLQCTASVGGLTGGRLCAPQVGCPVPVPWCATAYSAGWTLLSRVDRKYLLPAADLPSVPAGLPDDVQVLEIDARRRFGYRSAYFDPPGLDSDHGAARSRRRSFQLRAGTYVDSNLRFLEVKTSGGRGTTVNQRFPYAGDDGRLAPATTELAVTALSRVSVPDVGRRVDLTRTTEYRRITAALRPDLPANRWCAVLRRHFAHPETSRS
jgi:hypothetical protein